MHYWRHPYTVHMVYWGLEIVTMVYCRKFLLIYSNASWHLSDQTNGVFFFSRLVIGKVISAKAGMNDL